MAGDDRATTTVICITHRTGFLIGSVRFLSGTTGASLFTVFADCYILTRNFIKQTTYCFHTRFKLLQ